jgi:hypothetical protein
MIKNLFFTLLFLVLLPLFIPIVLLAMVAVVVLASAAWVHLRYRGVRRGQWHYLVYSPKAGWNEFVQNNLLPALPQSIVPVPVEEKRPSPQRHYVASVLNAGTGVAKPYLATVLPIGVRVRTLNRDLWKLKTSAAHNAKLQDLLHRYLLEQTQAAQGR